MRIILRLSNGRTRHSVFPGLLVPPPSVSQKEELITNENYTRGDRREFLLSPWKSAQKGTSDAKFIAHAVYKVRSGIRPRLFILFILHPSFTRSLASGDLLTACRELQAVSNFQCVSRNSVENTKGKRNYPGSQRINLLWCNVRWSFQSRPVGEAFNHVTVFNLQ